LFFCLASNTLPDKNLHTNEPLYNQNQTIKSIDSEGKQTKRPSIPDAG